MPSIAILGAGPTALTAAWACQAVGIKPTIFSRKVKSPIHGSQILREPIPSLLAPSADIQCTLQGDEVSYIRRVYGNDAEVDWTDTKTDLIQAWDIRALYRQLWDLLSPIVIDIALDPVSLNYLIHKYDIVISTIPMHWVCQSPSVHKFEAAMTWSAGETEDGSLRLRDFEWVPDNTIIRNGRSDANLYDWYRASRTFGVLTVEYPHSPVPPLPTAAMVAKPVATNCDCWSSVKRMGRFGAWDRLAHVHHAYQETIAIIHQHSKEAE